MKEKVGGGGRWGARTWQKPVRLGESPEQQASSEFQARRRGRGGGSSIARACEGRRQLLPLTWRTEGEPQPLGGVARGFPDGTSWRAGPGRALHGRWGAHFPRSRARGRRPPAAPGALLRAARRPAACWGAPPAPGSPPAPAPPLLEASPASPGLSPPRGTVPAARLSAPRKIRGS